MKRVLNANGHEEPGCLHNPLFNIPLVRLRITDRLEHALIYDAVDWDEVHEKKSKNIIFIIYV